MSSSLQPDGTVAPNEPEPTQEGESMGEAAGTDRPARPETAMSGQAPERPSDKAKKQTIEVTILGQRMVLKSDEDARHMERLASYVKRKVDEVSAGGPISASKLAVLAALNIADDYFRSLEDAREFRRQVASRSRALLNELES